MKISYFSEASSYFLFTYFLFCAVWKILNQISKSFLFLTGRTHSRPTSSPATATRTTFFPQIPMLLPCSGRQRPLAQFLAGPRRQSPADRHRPPITPALLWTVFGATSSTPSPALPAVAAGGRCRRCSTPREHLYPDKAVWTEHHIIAQPMRTLATMFRPQLPILCAALPRATADWCQTLLVCEGHPASRPTSPLSDAAAIAHSALPVPVPCTHWLLTPAVTKPNSCSFFCPSTPIRRKNPLV
jgi:hypothetical protein